jgi:hypothetical protein
VCVSCELLWIQNRTQQTEMFAVGDRLLSSPFHEGNLFTLLHVSVCAELLKALQKKGVFLSHRGIKKILPLLLKLYGDSRQYYGLILGSCSVLWSIHNHHMVQKPTEDHNLTDKQPWNPVILRNVPYSRESSWPSQRV